MFFRKTSWTEIEKKGKMHFIITKGMFGWGIPTAILFFIVTSLLDYGFNIDTYLNFELLKDLLISLVIFPLCGIICGWSLWKLLETKHMS